MGIPGRVDIISVWDKQCGSSKSAIMWLQLLACFSTIAAMVPTVFPIESAESFETDGGDLNVWGIAIVTVVPAIPVAAQVSSLLISTSSTDAPSFQSSDTLGVSLATAVLLAFVWLFNMMYGLAVVVCTLWLTRKETRRQDRLYRDMSNA
ncbi:hypothetical protein PINS_up019204 [Pythium insidiosum]|nr:hypothetical protein PINS_up019204 [Pythium insidiosum]